MAKQFISFFVATTILAALTVTGVKSSFAQSGATLLFKSGFEPGTTIGSVVDGGQSGFQYFSGTDKSSGFSWPMNWTPNSASETGTHNIYYTPWPSGDTSPSQIMNNSIVSMAGHNGNTTNVLAMQIFNWNVLKGCCAQDVMQIGGLSSSTPLRQFYQRYWMKLNPDAQSQMNADINNWFRSIFYLKTANDWRLELYLYPHQANTGEFHVQTDCNAGTPDCPNTQGQFWSATNSSIPIPFNQWFLVEIYINRGTPTDGTNGRFFFGVNGHTVFDISYPNGSCPGVQSIHNPTCWYGDQSQDLLFAGLSTVYGNSADTIANGSWVGHYMDDLEIWSAPPCANLPCGSGTVSTASSVQAPTNLTGTEH
jgi:hypothetical protein